MLLWQQTTPAACWTLHLFTIEAFVGSSDEDRKQPGGPDAVDDPRYECRRERLVALAGAHCEHDDWCVMGVLKLERTTNDIEVVLRRVEGDRTAIRCEIPAKRSR